MKVPAVGRMTWVGVGILCLGVALFVLGLVEALVTSVTDSTGAAWGAELGFGLGLQLAALGALVSLGSIGWAACSQLRRRIRRT